MNQLRRVFLRAFDSLVGDLRFAARYFARHKATVAIIVAVLALGTGANTMIFSLIQAEFRRPAPAVPDDPSHVRLWAQERRTTTARWDLRPFTWIELHSLAQRAADPGDRPAALAPLLGERARHRHRDRAQERRRAHLVGRGA